MLVSLNYGKGDGKGIIKIKKNAKKHKYYKLFSTLGLDLNLDKWPH